MATDIAKAYVQIIPSAEGISGNIAKVMGGEAEKAGATTGKSFSSSFGKSVGAGLKVAGGAAVAAATGVAALGKSLVSNAKETAAYGDNVDKLSQKIGISAQAFQEWDYVFGQNGADIGILEGGMKKLSSTLDDAKGGSDSAIETFKRLGVSVADLSTMSQEDMFGTVISALQEMPESAERTAIASDLLGRSAMELGPLLNQTAEDTEALKEQAHDLGMVMSDDDVKNSAALTDAMDNLDKAMMGAQNTIMSAMLPGLTDIANGFADLVAGNEGASEQLVQGFETLGNSINSAIPAVVDGVTSLISAIAEVAPQIVETLGSALLNALPTIASAVGKLIPEILKTLMQMLPQLVDVGFQIIQQLGTGLAEALPTLIPMAVQVMLDLVNTILENIPMLVDVANQIIVGLMDGLTQALPLLINALPGIITGIVDVLLQSLPILIQGTIQIINGLVQNMPTIIQALIEAAPQILTGIIGALVANAPMLVDAFIQLFAAVGSSWGDITMMLIQSIPQSFVEIANAFMALGPILVDTFNQLGIEAQTAWAAIQQAFANVGEWFRQKFTAASNGVKNAFNNVKTFFQNLWKSIQQVFSDAVSKFTSIGSDIANGILKGLSGSWANLKAFLQKACGDLIALAKRILGIASPSKEFAKQVGQWIPAGIAQGIHDGMGVLNKEIQGMSNEMLTGTIATSTEAINSVHFMQDAGAEAVGNSVVINNNIRVDGAQDPEAWTQTFISTLKREARMA